MAYSYRYINKNNQPSSVDYTLIIENRENDVLVGSIRIEKSFNVDEKLIDDEFLRLQAYKEIDRITREINQQGAE